MDAKRIARPFRAAVSAVASFGTARLCPCCGRSSALFLPYGRPRRSGVRCPHCGSLERHRLIWSYLRERYSDGSDPLRVLHAAPEQIIARNLASLAHVDYTSVDISPGRADVVADLTKRTPWPDASFDLIVCSHVLEHIEDDVGAMRELRRLLKRRGEAVILVPIKGEITFEDPLVTDPAARARVFGQHDHVRIYGADVKQRLEAAGFDVTPITPPDLVPGEHLARYALISDEQLLSCRPKGAGVCT